jgi:hypothetical protein
MAVAASEKAHGYFGKSIAWRCNTMALQLGAIAYQWDSHRHITLTRRLAGKCDRFVPRCNRLIKISVEPAATHTAMKLVKTDLRGLNASEVRDRAKDVLASMQDNPHFPDPKPSLAELATACADLDESIINTTEGGDKLAFFLKQQRLQVVSNMLRSLATYVSLIAQGDRMVVESAGFALRNRSTRITELDTPQRVQAKSGRQNGTIEVRWKPVRGARFYKVVATKNNARPDERPQETQTASSRCVITGMDPLEYYSISVMAEGSSAKSSFSAPVIALSIGMRAA